MLAQRRRIFVDRETGTVGSKLDQHTARLEKVDRLEPEAVDYFSGPTTSALDARTNDELRRVIGNAPRDVMNSTNSPATAFGIWNLANLQIPTGSTAFQAERSPLVFCSEIYEAEHAGKKCA